MRELEIQHLLEALITILRRYSVTQWAIQLERLKTEYNAALQSGKDEKQRVALENILHIYGGMASFGDIFIMHEAGFPILPEDVSRVNNEFQKLRTQLYVVVRGRISELKGNSTTG